MRAHGPSGTPSSAGAARAAKAKSSQTCCATSTAARSRRPAGRHGTSASLEELSAAQGHWHQLHRDAAELAGIAVSCDWSAAGVDSRWACPNGARVRDTVSHRAGKHDERRRLGGAPRTFQPCAQRIASGQKVTPTASGAAGPRDFCAKRASTRARGVRRRRAGRLAWAPWCSKERNKPWCRQ